MKINLHSAKRSDNVRPINIRQKERRNTTNVDVSLVPRNAEEETDVIGDLCKRLRELVENLGPKTILTAPAMNPAS
jgi:hypothetical protein